MQEPNAKHDLPDVFACFFAHYYMICLCLSLCMQMCVHLQGSHLMGFVEVSGSYQNVLHREQHMKYIIFLFSVFFS